MSEQVPESGEERIDESGRNPTQRRIDGEGASDAPGDVSWDERTYGETDPDDEEPSAA